MEDALEIKDVEEIVEAILIRLPPGEPENFVRASLVCKLWCRLLSDNGFLGRYRAFHNIPPMLGLLHSWFCNDPFIPITKFIPRGHPKHNNVADCRHGRVLFSDWVIWFPMTGNTRELPAPQRGDNWNTDECAAVLCAVDGCDHGACQSGPFFVVSISLDEEKVATAIVYSSETSTWSAPTSLDLGFIESDISLSWMPGVLSGGALHFILMHDARLGVLKYDLGTSCLSEIEPTFEIQSARYDSHALIAPEDGQLGIARLNGFNLSVYWREVCHDQVAMWKKSEVIDLKKHLLASDPMISHTELVGSVERTAIIFATSNIGTYMIDLKSLRPKKLTSELRLFNHPWALFPYFSFYNPPVGQVENVADLGESEMGSIDEESGESESRSSDRESGESDAGSSEGEMRKLMLEAPMMKQKKPKLETSSTKHRP
ncbi:hypothetical protein CFC21_107098 [Triticum aestivum]|uniref:F-box domain-containing protein n=2 Tax=Triticum aestivum TaxID=4565 RepID=A0A3B6TD43_WHEAT|nr:uncharacterized protein LOC123168072 [Triticum aestivum]KAF7106359.1 hypothetical protein CFC21_107098 [Triticum aestivum]